MGEVAAGLRLHSLVCDGSDSVGCTTREKKKKIKSKNRKKKKEKGKKSLEARNAQMGRCSSGAAQKVLASIVPLNASWRGRVRRMMWCYYYTSRSERSKQELEMWKGRLDGVDGNN